MRKRFNLMLALAMAFACGVSVVNAYTVQFKRAEGDDYAKYGTGEPIVIKTCTTNASGKLDSSCLDVAYKVCHVWNTNQCKVYPGSYNGISYNGYYPACSTQTEASAVGIDTLKSKTFTSDAVYYCHGGSSQHPASDNIGCYVCNSNSNVMKWDTDGAADSNCSSGYTYDGSKNETQCKTKTTPTPTVKPTPTPTVKPTPTPTVKPTPTPTATPTPTPTTTPTPTSTPSNGCYVCNSDKTVMVWKANGKGDANCPAGYTKDITKNQSQCKTTEKPTEACYVCKTNDQVFKWSTNGNGDDNCSGGYNKTDLPKDSCIANPKTGASKELIALLIELASFAVIIGYVSGTIFKDNKASK